MDQYQDFPKVMKHPSYRPAVPYKQPRYRPGEEGWGKPVDPGATGKPAQFPDVTVHNMDQEQEYAAKGYRPAGTTDPEAYRRAMTNNEPRPASSFSEYPKMLYRKARSATKDGSDLETRTVVSDAEEEASISAGWSVSPDQARSGRRTGKTEKREAAVDKDVAPAQVETKKSSGRGRAKSPEAETARREKIRASMKQRAAERGAGAG